VDGRIRQIRGIAGSGQFEKHFGILMKPTQRSKGEKWKLTNSLECKNCKEQGRIFILLSDHFPDLGQHTANRNELDRFSAQNVGTCVFPS